MPEVRKLDSRRRVVFPERFSPGDQFIEELVSPDEVVFRLIRPTEVPLVKVEEKGGLPLIRAKFDARKIEQALRDDRDSR